MKYKKIILISILTIGFVIRLSTLVQLSSTALFNPVCMDKHDQKTFHLWAQSILKHPFYVDGDAFYMAPLYPYFLALIYAISGGSVFFAGIVQALLDVFAIYLIYLLGKKIKDETTGLIAAGLYAFYQTIVLYSVAILSDGLITFLNICFIFSLYTALEKKRWSFWILSGIILGLAALAKPTILAFIPFVIVGFFIGQKQESVH
jgi:4-amino-4-deoxy-L-arabinose transferase-like glycosyltransferase